MATLAQQSDPAAAVVGGGGQASSQIRLVSQDDREFIVSTAVARVSITIRTMLDDLVGGEAVMDQDGGPAAEVVPLPNVRGDILERVITWATYHKDDPPFEEEDDRTEKRTDDIQPWDVDFLKDLQQPILFDLILAANYLDIKGLLDCTCKTVANLIKGKTPDEIRATFNIQNDFTAAEEEQIRKENEWCEEK